MGEPVQKPILGVGRFAGLNREYSVEYSIGSAAANERLGLQREYSREYSSARLEAWLEAWLGLARRGLNGSNMARVDVTRLLPLARVGATGLQLPELQVARVDHPGVRLS